MTRKDYILLAEALKDSVCITAGRSMDYEIGCRTQFEVTAHKVASMLAHENPRFDRVRFLVAAGVQS